MSRIALVGVAALVAALGAAGSTAPSAVTGESTAALADALWRKLQLLRDRHAAGATESVEIEVTEEEANAYLGARLSDRLPVGVGSPWMAFEPGVVVGGAAVDPALLARSADPLLATIGRLVEAPVPVEVRAQFEGAEGRGRIEIESASVAGVPLPATWVRRWLEGRVGAGWPEGIVVGEPFPLPYGIETAVVRQGRVLVRQGPSDGRRRGDGEERPGAR